MTEREFDLIIYGASGFTGRLVAEYIYQTYGTDNLNWAMAGRSEAKLADVRDEMNISSAVELITANSDDPNSLARMATRTKLIITTVGPYQLYGTDLVIACARAGTDYVDLCGEPAWMRDIIHNYSDTAKDTGARIVLSCGFDSIPFDLGVLFLQNAAKESFGHTLPKVRTRVRKMKGTFSGGTAASFMASMSRATKEPEVLNWLKDPFALTPDFNGPPQPTGHKPIYEDDIGSWSAPFIMASINTKNIHRSNALMDHAYGEDFTYGEMMLTGPGDAGEAAANGLANHNPFGNNPPKPGEGPSKEERENGFYELLIIGDGLNGEHIRAMVSGDKDPGYGSTSKMIAETAMCLLQDRPSTQTGGGIFTSAPALGTALITRLQGQAGLKFEIEDS